MKNLIINLFLISSMIAYSQNEQTDKICKEYDQKIQTAIDEEVIYAVPQIQITTTLSKRAIGPVNHKITIYFDEYEIEIEEGEEVSFHKEAVIRKVEFTIASVSYQIDYHYYFDEGGLLIRYDEKEIGYECVHTTTYFKDKEPTRIVQKPLTDENCQAEKPAESFDKKELGKREKAEATWILDEAKKFRELLFLNYEFVKN
ncbi:MAG: hypothetical protein R2780_10000 [Crocinitomicaceae bacterium]|nr:hypothetical protein [Crocinitomicaceae bacterium]